MAKTSPGPWTHYHELFRPQISKMMVHEIHDANGHVVVQWMGFDGLRPDMPKSQIKANARLISAAHDLRAACEAAMIFMDEFAAAGNKYAPKVARQMKAALRKAGATVDSSAKKS